MRRRIVEKASLPEINHSLPQINFNSHMKSEFTPSASIYVLVVLKHIVGIL